MAQLSAAEYDSLERAIVDGKRVVVYRRGTEYVVIALALRMEGSREVIDSRHPTTGDALRFFIDELDTIQIIP